MISHENEILDQSGQSTSSRSRFCWRSILGWTTTIWIWCGFEVGTKPSTGESGCRDRWRPHWQTSSSRMSPSCRKGSKVLRIVIRWACGLSSKCVHDYDYAHIIYVGKKSFSKDSDVYLQLVRRHFRICKRTTLSNSSATFSAVQTSFSPFIANSKTQTSDASKVSETKAIFCPTTSRIL